MKTAMLKPLSLALAGLALAATVATADPQDTPNRPGAPVTCDGRLDPQFNAIKADPALTAEERDARLTEVWETCKSQVFDAIDGRTQMAVTLTVDAHVDAAIAGADADVASAHADAAVAGVAANSADPDHRVTNSLVAQYRRDRREAD